MESQEFPRSFPQEGLWESRAESVSHLVAHAEAELVVSCVCSRGFDADGLTDTRRMLVTLTEHADVQVLTHVGRTGRAFVPIACFT